MLLGASDKKEFANLLLLPRQKVCLNVTLSRRFTSELKKCDYMHSCPVHTGLETPDPDHMWVKKKLGQLGLHCECSFRSRAVYLYGLSKIRRKGPKDRVWEALALKWEASTSQFWMGEETHWISWMCVSATNRQREQSRALEIPLLKQNGYFVSINQ